MRILVELTANSEMALTADVQYKIRGILWNYLSGTPFEELHDSSNVPTFAFSNIFPKGGFDGIGETLSEHQSCQFMISSPHQRMAEIIQNKLETVQTLEIGDYQFTVTSVQPLSVDVGGVGSTGTLKTSTGLYLRLPEEEREKYGLDVKYDGVISWVPDFGLDVFQGRLMDNINWKLNSLTPHMRHPSQFSDLFESVQILTVVEKDVHVTEDHRTTFLTPICQFEYHISSSEQQTWLNTLLDTGFGWKNPLGFGFTNIVESDKEDNPYIGKKSIQN